MKSSFVSQPLAKCYHCGEACDEQKLLFEDKSFCCQGCKLVYEVISENNLCEFYHIEDNPGISQRNNQSRANKFDYLADPDVEKGLIDFKNEEETHVTFYIPLIHCASCIWLLENLNQIHSGVIGSRVDFLKKKVQVRFRQSKINLKELVNLLSTIGYEPKINLSDLDTKKIYQADKRTIKRLAVAGFCFGNMMLFSIPEYFAEAKLLGEGFKGLFNYLNVILSLPVVFYSASDYYISALNSLRQRQINMDVPIVLGILAFFFYSLWDIFGLNQSGYMDSLGGLLFFLLLGKLYQQKTFSTLEFDRDYKSYFPIAVTKLVQGKEEVIPLTKILVGDLILVRNEELIPADSILLSEKATIDYSFVTGEEIPVPKQKGELVYAGGRQKGEPILLTIQKSPSQGYLTDLWNNESFEKSKEGLLEPLATRISGRFTWVVLGIAFLTLFVWSFSDFPMGVKAFTSVLIVACPCALSMSTPFTLGNTLRIFGKGKFYLKNAGVIERLGMLDAIVFDKTGTLTDPSSALISYQGEELSQETLTILKSLVERSTHPLSNRINYWLGDIEGIQLDQVREVKGQGLMGIYKSQEIKLGSEAFTGASAAARVNSGNLVFLTIEGLEIGFFHIESGLRDGVSDVIKELDSEYSLYVLSGDHSHEQVSLVQKLGGSIVYNFHQSPVDKLDYLQTLKQTGHHTLMVGDGLNDAGALQASEVGIAITDRVSHFSPASDAILDATSFSKIPMFLAFARNSRSIIKASFGISFLYNIVGLTLAVQGLLSPVICAILMPVSSISVVVFTTAATNLMAWKKGLLTPKPD
jgi:Cu+-exporting ATPase